MRQGANVRGFRGKEPMVTADNRFEELIQRLQIGVLILGPDGELIAANNVAPVQLGISVEEFARHAVAEPIWTALQEDGQPFAPEDRPVARALRTGESARDIVVGIQTPDTGTVVWFLVNVDPVRDQTGRLSYVVCTYVDITERQKTTERLRVKEAQQEAVAELGQLALRGASLQEIRDDALRRVTDILHVRFAAASQRQPDGLLHLVAVRGWPHDMTGGLSLEPTADTQAGYTLLTHLPTIVEDTETETRFGIAPALFEAGISSGLTVIIPGETEPAGVLGVYSQAPRAFTQDDIAFVQSMANVLGAVIQHECVEAERDRALAEQVIARERAEYLAAQRDAILMQTAESVVIADADGTIIFANDAARTMLGQDPTGATFEQYAQAFNAYTEDGDLADADKTALGRALLEGEPVLGARRRVQRPDGTEIVAVGNAVPLIGEDGSRLGAVATYRDVTQEYHMSQQKSDFLSAAAHDLKGPLTTIKGHAQMLLRRARRADAVPSERVIDDAERIEATSTRMANLITDLLDVTRIELGHELDLVRRRVDLFPLVKDVVHELSEDEPEGRIVVHGEGEIPSGMWDDVRLRRVVTNLVTNALKYSPEESRIEVGVRTTEADARSYAELAVRDRGIGIPAKDLPRIFERYYRAGNVPPRTEGSGIGLAGVKQIVEQLDGTVEVESEEGQGTTVRVFLPLDASPDEV